jgi:hypothetical protein
MTRQEDSVVQFLIGLGVLDSEDAKTVQEAQVEPIVRVMIEREALAVSHASQARELITELLTSSNHTKRLKAQMTLMKLITGKMHSRINVSSDKIRQHKERITSGHFPAVAAALAKSSGD